MYKRGFSIIVLIMLLITSTIFTVYGDSKAKKNGNKKDIKVGIYSNEPLLSMTEHGADGFIVDLVEEVARREGWSLTYIENSFLGSLEAIENNEIDLMIGVAWSAERSKKYEFSKETIFVNWGQVYGSLVHDIESFSDLAGQKIGVMDSDIHYKGQGGIENTLKQFDIRAEFVVFEDKLDILSGVESGDLYAGVLNRTFGFIHENNYNVKKASIQLNPIKIHIIAPLDGDKELIDTIDTYIKKWKLDSESFYYEKLASWFDFTVDTKIPKVVWGVLSIIVTLLLVLLVIIFITRGTIRIQTKELRLLNNDLEYLVKERTKDLDEANDNLKNSFLDLKEKQAELEEMNSILEEQIDVLEKTKDQLIASEKMASLGRLVTSLSHELNTPLGICVTLSSNLSVQTKDQQKNLENGILKRAELHEYLHDVKETAIMFENNLHIIVDLVNRFKMVSKDRIQNNERKINFYDFIHTQMKSLSPELKNTGHEYEISCPEDLFVVLDPGALSQVIRNMTVNSLLHGFEHKSKGKIKIKVSSDEHQVHISYWDNGKGIDNDIEDRLFEPFFTTKRGEGGTGLGLSISYSTITQSMNGSIKVDKTFNNGLKFDIDLPYRKN